MGYEFRAITDPTRLYKAVEPFGLNENNPDGAFMKDAYHYKQQAYNEVGEEAGMQDISLKKVKDQWCTAGTGMKTFCKNLSKL